MSPACLGLEKGVGTGMKTKSVADVIPASQSRPRLQFHISSFQWKVDMIV